MSGSTAVADQPSARAEAGRVLPGFATDPRRSPPPSHDLVSVSHVASGPPGGRPTPETPGRSRRNRTAETAVRLAELDRQRRRLAILRAAGTIALSWVLIVGAFYALPIGHESGLRAFLRLCADIALVGAVFAWQIRRISLAELPELRAVEALGIVVVLFLVAFSAIYLAMSHDAATTFTQPLDHTRALYFTVSVFSTVGFGDITPKTDSARLVVSAQMLLDLVLIGAVVRLLFNAARSRISPAGPEGGSPAQG
jgi:voltage-gated potassium channel